MLSDSSAGTGSSPNDGVGSGADAMPSLDEPGGDQAEDGGSSAAAMVAPTITETNTSKTRINEAGIGEAMQKTNSAQEVSAKNKRRIL